MNRYAAFELSDTSRREILERFDPTFDRVVCDHITVEFNLKEEDVEALTDRYAGADLAVVGYRCGDGVECLVVTVDDNPQRPDGKLFHITLSLGRGHKPVESNWLLMAEGYQSCLPMPITGEFKLLLK